MSRFKDRKKYLQSLSEDYVSIDEEAELEQKFIDQIEKQIYESKLSEEQKATLELFKSNSISKNGCKPRSLVPHIWLMKVLGERTKKPYLEITEEDVDEFLYFIKTTTNQRGRKYRPRSIVSFNVSLKMFFKWLYDKNKIKYEGNSPDIVNELSTIVPRDNLHTNKLLTPTEVKRMIESCYKLRDKTVIALLYETGCRAGEMINLNIGDVKQERDSFDINIRISKTQPRTVYAISSYAYLKEYIDAHPWKTNPNAPLFINVSNLAFGRRLLYQGLASLVSTARKRSRLEKKVHPHLFRHSRATELASKGWTEMKLRCWFGWNKTSGTPSTYIHIGQSDIKKQILKEHGLLSDEESIDDMNQRLALEPKVCLSCGKKNAPDSIACNCGRSLSYDNISELRKLKTDTDDYVNKLNNVPLRPELMTPNMKPIDYKMKMITEDPFLKAEFEKIATEIIQKLNLKDEDRYESFMTKNRASDRSRDDVLNLRNKGWPMQEIAKKLCVGYGTVNKICKDAELTKLY